MLDTLWGQGRDLDAIQMAVRAFVVFFVALALVRISGRRSFGRRSAFDNIIVIMLGTVLGRPIFGASPFWPVVAGSFVLVVIHRALGLATSRFPRIERFAKGQPYVLWHDGKLEAHEMLRNEISTGDLDSAARLQTHRANHADVSEIRIETSGELSVVESGSGAVGR